MQNLLLNVNVKNITSNKVFYKLAETSYIYFTTHLQTHINSVLHPLAQLMLNIKLPKNSRKTRFARINSPQIAYRHLQSLDFNRI